MLTCDKCDKPFEVDNDAQAGEKVSCPYCGDITRVPPGGVLTAVPAGKPAASAAPAASGAAASSAREEPERQILLVRQAMFRAHPFWYGLMVLLGVCGLAILIFSFTSAQFSQPAWMWLGVAGLGAAVLWWLIWWGAPHRWVKLVITNKRTIRHEGIVVRKTSEVLHRHVTNVTIKQGLVNRMLDVGYIGIDSAGQGGEAVGEGDSPARRSQIEIEVANIPHPYKIKDIIDQYR